MPVAPPQLVPEHIVFCIDCSIDGMMNLPRYAGDEEHSRLEAAKLLVKRFITIKSRIAAGKMDHKFAIASFAKETEWNCDLTTADKAIRAVDSIKQQYESDSWQANAFFDTVTERAAALYPPSYATRVILLYFRANSIPTFDKSKVDRFLKLKNSFLDIVYLHDKVSEASARASIQTVFDSLHDLTDAVAEDQCYILETTMYRRYVANFARLLAHPLQRILNGWLGVDSEKEVEMAEASIISV